MENFISRFLNEKIEKAQQEKEDARQDAEKAHGELTESMRRHNQALDELARVHEDIAADRKQRRMRDIAQDVEIKKLKAELKRSEAELEQAKVARKNARSVAEQEAEEAKKKDLEKLAYWKAKNNSHRLRD